jgi:hypothetical protein
LAVIPITPQDTCCNRRNTERARAVSACQRAREVDKSTVVVDRSGERAADDRGDGHRHGRVRADRDSPPIDCLARDRQFGGFPGSARERHCPFVDQPFRRNRRRGPQFRIADIDRDGVGKKRVTITMVEAIVRSLAVNAARGQLRSQQALTKMIAETEKALG